MKKIIVRISILLLTASLLLCCLSAACAEGDNSYFTQDVTNILIVGQDNDNIGGLDKAGNADGQIILSINKKTGQIILSSIARDTFLMSTNDKTGTKATLIYHDFGIETLIDAIEVSLDIPIDNYVIFNYLSVMDLVDALGGVDADMYAAEIYTANGKIRQTNRDLLLLPEDDGLIYPEEDGLFHLTGKQATGYMRVRLSDHTRDDFGRTERERGVIIGLKDAMFSAAPEKLSELLVELLPNIRTDFSLEEMLEIISTLNSVSDYQIVSQRVPIDGSYSGSEGFTHMEFDVNRAFLKQTIYGN